MLSTFTKTHFNLFFPFSKCVLFVFVSVIIAENGDDSSSDESTPSPATEGR